MSSLSNINEKKLNFLRQYRDEKTKQIKTLTSQEFIEILNHYDTDGYIYIHLFRNKSLHYEMFF